MNPVTVYGGGSWGMTLALLLARKGIPVALWDRDPGQRSRLGQERGLPSALPGILLPDSVEVLYEESVPVPKGEIRVLAVPSHGMRWLLEALQAQGAASEGDRLWVVATKGLEEDSCKTMTQVVAEVLGADTAEFPSRDAVVVLAGPSLALEVAQGKPAALLAASTQAEAAVRVQRLFATESFRVYTSDDPLGVEIGTSLKNVIALAAGIADGLGLGQNTRGALLTRGLAEIGRLGVALGAKPETFLGLAGMGDLITTCTSPLSRNHTLGEALARGESLEAALPRIGMVVEGVRTTRAACDLATRAGVELPIAREVYRILFEGLQPAVALRKLMTRPLRPE